MILDRARMHNWIHVIKEIKDLKGAFYVLIVACLTHTTLILFGLGTNCVEDTLSMTYRPLCNLLMISNSTILRVYLEIGERFAPGCFHIRNIDLHLQFYLNTTYLISYFISHDFWDWFPMDR